MHIGKYNGIDLYADTNKMYECYEFEPCIFFRDDYTNDDCFLPISLTEEENWNQLFEKCNIYIADLYEIYTYIRNNRHKFLNVADCICNYSSLQTLNEKAELDKNITGLYDTIWIDNGGAVDKSGHSGSDRIKYKALSNDGPSTNWTPLIVKGGITPHPPKYDWPAKEKEKLVKFVELNQDIIKRARIEHWSMGQFVQHMYRYGKNTKQFIPPKNPKDYKDIRNIGFGWTLVKNIKDGKYSLTKDGGIPIQNMWFDFITEFKYFKNGFCLACNNGLYFKIYPNRTIKKHNFKLYNIIIQQMIRQ